MCTVQLYSFCRTVCLGFVTRQIFCVVSCVGGSITQSDMAAALAEIHKIDPNFDKEAFVKECQFEIIPTVLEAYLRGNLPVLKDWCHEAVSSCMNKGTEWTRPSTINLCFTTGFPSSVGIQCVISHHQAES